MKQPTEKNKKEQSQLILKPTQFTKFRFKRKSAKLYFLSVSKYSTFLLPFRVCADVGAAFCQAVCPARSRKSIFT